MPFEQKISALGLRAEEGDIMQDILPAAVVAALIGSMSGFATIGVNRLIEYGKDKKNAYNKRLERLYFPFNRALFMYYDETKDEILHEEKIAIKIIEKILLGNVECMGTNTQKEFYIFYRYYTNCYADKSIEDNWKMIEKKFKHFALILFEEYKKISRKVGLEVPADLIK